jgi:hypothetical protein
MSLLNCLTAFAYHFTLRGKTLLMHSSQQNIKGLMIYLQAQGWAQGV